MSKVISRKKIAILQCDDELYSYTRYSLVLGQLRIDVRFPGLGAADKKAKRMNGSMMVPNIVLYTRNWIGRVLEEASGGNFRRGMKSDRRS